MANLISNRLLIEGREVQRVMEACGFLTLSHQFDDTRGELVLVNPWRIDKEIQDRILPASEEHLGDDLLELTDDRAHFRFYTKGVPARETVEAPAQRFPSCRFTLVGIDLANFEDIELGGLEDHWKYVFDCGGLISEATGGYAADDGDIAL